MTHNTSQPTSLRIATRSSQLALWQADYVAARLRELHPGLLVELVDVTTQGDVDQSQPLRAFGGMGVFTKEVQRAVLDGRADLAVHSLKDLPTESTEPNLGLAAVPEREVHWDALVLPLGKHCHIEASDRLACLREGARVGSGSLRRQAQIKAARPDLQLLEIRGNLNTRLRKLDEGEYDALILAAAGLMRLEWCDRISEMLTPPLMFPAVGQGALGLECRLDDARCRDLLAPLNDVPTRICVEAERSLLATLRAGCHAPVGVQAEWQADTLSLTAVVLSPTGDRRLQAQAQTALTQATCEQSDLALLVSTASQLGRMVAEELFAQGADALLNRKSVS